MNSEKKYCIILFGPPGSGKTSLSNKLSSSDDYEIIQTGELLRAEVKAETELGDKVKSFLNEGKLAPTELAVKIVNRKINNSDSNKFIFDGSPRTVEESDSFLNMLKENEIEIKNIIILFLEFDTVRKRITGRRICPNGKIYNIYFKPPNQKGICDVCNQKLKQRDDDKEEIVKKRFDEYKKNTMTVIQKYRNEYSGKRIEVDAEKSIDEIMKIVNECLEGNDENGIKRT